LLFIFVKWVMRTGTAFFDELYAHEQLEHCELVTHDLPDWMDPQRFVGDGDAVRLAVGEDEDAAAAARVGDADAARVETRTMKQRRFEKLMPKPTQRLFEKRKRKRARSEKLMPKPGRSARPKQRLFEKPMPRPSASNLVRLQLPQPELRMVSATAKESLLQRVLA